MTKQEFEIYSVNIYVNYKMCDTNLVNLTVNISDIYCLIFVHSVVKSWNI